MKGEFTMDLGFYISLWLCVGIAVGFIISGMNR